MKLEVFDKDTRIRLGMISIYTYCMYKDEYNGKGSFSITIPVNDEIVEHLVMFNYILFDDGVLGVIRGRKSSQDDDLSIDVYGYLSNSILTYRCIMKTMRYTGTPTAIARQMVSDLFIESNMEERRVEYIRLATDEEYIPEFEDEIEVIDTGDNLLEALEKKLAIFDLGFELYPVISNFGDNVHGTSESVPIESSDYSWGVIENGVKGGFVKIGDTDEWKATFNNLGTAYLLYSTSYEITVPEDVKYDVKYSVSDIDIYFSFILDGKNKNLHNSEIIKKEIYSVVLEKGYHKLEIEAGGRSLYINTGAYASVELPDVKMKTYGAVNLSSFEFRVRKAVDRSIGNEEGNTPVVFSFELNNLSSLRYEEDGREYASVAIVAGEGVGVNRKVIEVGDGTKTGIDRIEAYIDARDIQSDSEGSVISSFEGTKILTDKELKEMMVQRGVEKLEEHQVFKSFDGTIAVGGMSYTYGKDFFKGDYVSVYSKELNIVAKLKITSVIKTISSGVEHLDIGFGYDRLDMKNMRGE